MNIELFCDFCTNKKGVTETFPFGKNVLVYKVMGKIFALADIENFSSINLKCNPEMVIELQERFSAVGAGYHMNKKHWITVCIDGSVSNQQFSDWIDNSYNLVVASLPKSKRLELASL